MATHGQIGAVELDGGAGGRDGFVLVMPQLASRQRSWVAAFPGVFSR
jgi:hypothetical protein